MSQRCPVCGARFSKAARFCDQDGAILVPVGHSLEERTGFRRLWIGGVIALLLAGGIALPFVVQRLVRWNVDVVLEEARLGTGTEPGIGEGSLLQGLSDLFEHLVRGEEPPGLILQLKVRNGSPLTLSVQSARYAVEVDERQVATGVWIPDAASWSVSPGEELTIQVTLHPQPELEVDPDWLRRRPTLRVSGDLALEILGLPLKLPFEVRRVQFGEIPEQEEASPPSQGAEPERDSELNSWV